MNFYVKRLFLNSKYKLNNYSKKTIYIKCPNDYIKNKFLNILSKNLYHKETSYLYFHDNFKTNYVNHILMPELSLYITSTNTKDKTHTLNLNNTINLSPLNTMQHNINKINLLKKYFFSNVNQIYSLFKSICKNYSSNLDVKIFNEFLNEFSKNIFKNNTKTKEYTNSEYFISSVGIKGFKTFSTYIPSNENKIFIINDDFNLFKNILMNEILKKCKISNIPYEIFKNPLEKSIVDHIKLPSLNLCIISNNFLFKEKIPGIQINQNMFYKNKIENKEILNQKKRLKTLITNLNYLCELLENEYLILNNFFEKCIIEYKFENLINYTLKNVIR